jgi:hypothetical protein
MVQFTCTYPRLHHALLTHQFHNSLIPLCSVHFSRCALIVGLSAHADKAAGFADTYSNSFFFGKDALKGFFGSLTPYSF